MMSGSNLNKLKICHVAETFLPKIGGMQVIIDRLAAEQAKRGHQVWVACPAYGGGENEAERGYRINRVFGSTVPGFAAGVPAWLRWAAREKFDIIHAHNVWPGGSLGLMARTFGGKLVVTSHGRDILTEPSIKYGSRLNPVIASITRFTLKRADHHTVVSRSMLGPAVEAGTAPQRLTVVPNFVPPAAGESPEDAGLAQELPEKYLLALGRLHAVKGFDQAIRAFKQVKNARPELELVIVGDGGEKAALEGLAADLGLGGDVKFIGQVNHGGKVALLEQAQAVIITSLVEAFCLVAIEAMSTGTPVLVPEKEPFTDLIKDGAGLFVDPKEPGTFLSALRELDDPNKLRDIRNKAREAAARYTVESAAALYEKTYARVLGIKSEALVT